MSRFGAILVFGALTAITVGDYRTPLHHAVCFNSAGDIDINSKQNYPVTWHNFIDPTNNEKLKGHALNLQSRQLAFWQMEFTMPAIVAGISVIAYRPTDLINITIQLLNKKKEVRKALSSFSETATLNYTFSPARQVYFIKIIKTGESELSFADIKVSGTQAPARTQCVRNVRALPDGCYHFHLWRQESVQYDCRNGFRLQGIKGSILCSRKLGTSLKCQRVPLRCSAPPSMPHSLHRVEQRRYFENETFQYECELGYYLVGPSTITCRSNGNWTPTTTPSCRDDLKCSTPDVPLNGYKSGTNYRVNSTVSFSCQNGYQLSGPQTIRCTSELQWNPEPNVKCEATTCPQVSRSAVANGKVKLRELSQSGYVYGNFLHIVCDRGYESVGNDIIFCTANGDWDSSLPRCVQIFESGPCAVRSPCRLGKECIVTPYNESKCVCSASLGHGCISTIAPMCSTEHLTFWSDCDMKNYSCLYPQKQFSILRQSRCNEGSRTKVTVNTTRGIETRHVYKCSLPKKVGPCKTANTRFYFDQDVNRCKSFVWGGCAPNSNNFESMEQCQKDCKEFQRCNRNEIQNSGVNVAKGRPTSPSNSLSASFVDGSRIYNESTEVAFSEWNVSLLWQATISEIVVWNSDYNLPSLTITLYYDNLEVIAKTIDRVGLCKYGWVLPSTTIATSVSLETSASSTLHVDEVEVFGIIDRGRKINFLQVAATAIQYPGTASQNTMSGNASNAINGILERNSGPGHGFLTCSSTLLRNSERPWLQVDLKKPYFITEIELFLRRGEERRHWQQGLTVHVTNTPLRFRPVTSALVNVLNRCGEPYSSPIDQTPKFPCYYLHPSQYVVLTLLQAHSLSGLQVCEIQVFAVACNDLTAIDHVRVESQTDNFAPAEASYTCETGYYPVPSQRLLTCGRDGKWLTQHGSEPYCQEIQQTSTSLPTFLTSASGP